MMETKRDFPGRRKGGPVETVTADALNSKRFCRARHGVDTAVQVRPTQDIQANVESTSHRSEPVTKDVDPVSQCTVESFFSLFYRLLTERFVSRDAAGVKNDVQEANNRRDALRWRWKDFLTRNIQDGTWPGRWLWQSLVERNEWGTLWVRNWVGNRVVSMTSIVGNWRAIYLRCLLRASAYDEIRQNKLNEQVLSVRERHHASTAGDALMTCNSSSSSANVAQSFIRYQSNVSCTQNTCHPRASRVDLTRLCEDVEKFPYRSTGEPNGETYGKAPKSYESCSGTQTGDDYYFRRGASWQSGDWQCRLSPELNTAGGSAHVASVPDREQSNPEQWSICNELLNATSNDALSNLIQAEEMRAEDIPMHSISDTRPSLGLSFLTSHTNEPPLDPFAPLIISSNARHHRCSTESGILTDSEYPLPETRWRMFSWIFDATQETDRETTERGSDEHRGSRPVSNSIIIGTQNRRERAHYRYSLRTRLNGNERVYGAPDDIANMGGSSYNDLAALEESMDTSNQTYSSQKGADSCMIEQFTLVNTYRRPVKKPSLSRLILGHFDKMNMIDNRCDIKLRDRDSAQKRDTSAIYDTKDNDWAYEWDSCVVCLEVFDDGDAVRILPCLHTYHKDCIDRWLVHNRMCPICTHRIDNNREPRSPKSIQGQHRPIRSSVSQNSIPEADDNLAENDVNIRADVHHLLYPDEDPTELVEIELTWRDLLRVAAQSIPRRSESHTGCMSDATGSCE